MGRHAARGRCDAGRPRRPRSTIVKNDLASSSDKSRKDENAKSGENRQRACDELSSRKRYRFVPSFLRDLLGMSMATRPDNDTSVVFSPKKAPFPLHAECHKTAGSNARRGQRVPASSPYGFSAWPGLSGLARMLHVCPSFRTHCFPRATCLWIACTSTSCLPKQLEITHNTIVCLWEVAS